MVPSLALFPNLEENPSQSGLVSRKVENEQSLKFVRSWREGGLKIPDYMSGRDLR